MQRQFFDQIAGQIGNIDPGRLQAALRELRLVSCMMFLSSTLTGISEQYLQKMSQVILLGVTDHLPQITHKGACSHKR